MWVFLLVKKFEAVGEKFLGCASAAAPVQHIPCHFVEKHGHGRLEGRLFERVLGP